MGQITDVVQVNITRQTKTVSRQGFGIPLIVGSNGSFAERVRVYGSLSGVAEDFSNDDFEYKMAQKIFSQTIHPPQIMIGRCGTAIKKKVKLTPDTPSDGDVFSVTINGTTYSVTASGDTVETIIDDIITAITGGAEPVTLTDNATNFDMEANVAGVDFTLKVSNNISIKATDVYNEDVVNALQEIRNENDDWYFILLTNRTQSVIEDVAEEIEALPTKLFVALSSDTDIKRVGSSDVASTLKSFGYDKSLICYSEYPEDCMDASWTSVMAPKLPGSATWKFKKLTGVRADNLTDTEITTILGKNCNIYDIIAGTNITREGVVASGEFTDIIRGTDWIQVNIQVDVYTGLSNADKIEFTNAGTDVIRNLVLGVLNRAVTNGILKIDPAPDVIIPDIADIPYSDRVARFLDNVEFSGYYKGAIHKVQIRGNLSV